MQQSHKRLAENMAEKLKEPYASVINMHKDKGQICPLEEHPRCHTRITRQTKWCHLQSRTSRTLA